MALLALNAVSPEISTAVGEQLDNVFILHYILSVRHDETDRRIYANIKPECRHRERDSQSQS